jgi:predicted  nucleic acid-binding Zn-ribbon protein
MSTTLLLRLTKLDNEIAAIATAIKAEKDAYLKAVEDEKSDKYLQALEKSLDALRTKEALLIDSRDKLQHDIATHPNQGKFTYCQLSYINMCRSQTQTLGQSVC